MIPKIIHYCWMSDDPIPERLKAYMDSWHEKLPDFEFMLWNYDRFPKGQSRWLDEAFEAEMYAFCADYLRLYALYLYGGFYLDSDVEVLKDLTPLLHLSTAVSRQNQLNGLELAAFGVEKGSEWIKLILDEYDKKTFLDEKGYFNETPMPYVVDEILASHGYIYKEVYSPSEILAEQSPKTISVLPSEYLSPKRFLENTLDLTANTFCIHHFMGSWTDTPKYEKMEQRFWNYFHQPNRFILTRILNIFTMRSNIWGKYRKRRGRSPL